MSSCLDDPQWADPESVEAIRWLLARAQGDQLLIVIGIQPAAGPMARAQSFSASAGQLIRFTLTDLSEPSRAP